VIHRILSCTALSIALHFAFSFDAKAAAEEPAMHADACPPQVQCSPAENDPDAVEAFWSTGDRMQKAEQLVGPGPQTPPEPAITPDADEFGYAVVKDSYADTEWSRTTGTLFVQQPSASQPEGHLTHCTASIIHSRGRNLILTARHCVRDSAGWFKNVLFVPAYKRPGNEPLPWGIWAVKRAFVPADIAGIPGDLAVLSVHPSHDGNNLEDAVGSRLMPKLSKDEIFSLVVNPGYPGTSPYPGRGEAGLQHYCISTSRPSSASPEAISTPNCSATQGDSGGPIITYAPDASMDEVPAVVAVVSSKHLPRLQPTNFCPIYRAAEEQDVAAFSAPLDVCGDEM
jgi:hypothetical protein